MANSILLFLGAGLTALWGIAHLFPTRSVVEGFGNISADVLIALGAFLR